ncbi:hypothetical protein GF337_01485 [candidate division KSB1 bacterium]|nr:hypothetical protein [candidate division KSB1 bacterium]
MHSVDNEKSGKLKNKTKAQLTKELVSAQKRITELTVQLQQCRDQRQPAAGDTTEIEDLREKLVTAENDLNQSMEEMEIIIGKSDQLEKDNAELAQTVNDLEKKLLECERESKNIVQPQIELDEPSAEKETFRIEFCNREEDYQGRIEHVLTKENKTFTGPDSKAIIDFISQHIKKPEMQASAPCVPVPAKLKNPEFAVRNQSFNMKLKFDLSKIEIDQEDPVTCHIMIYAKPIGIGRRKLIVETQKQINASGIYNIDLTADMLSSGAYQLEGALTSMRALNKSSPFSASLKGSLIYVH